MSKFRNDIRRHEAKTGGKFGCFGPIRCLSCPMSYLNCPIARKNLK